MTIRVALVAPQGLDGKGGIARMMVYLMRAFEAGGQVTPILVPTRYVQVPILNHLTSIPALAWFFAQCLLRRFDVVHLNVAPDGSTWRKMAFRAVARLFGLPVVLHLHGSAYDEYFRKCGPRQQRVIRAFFANADAVLVLGQFWRRFVVEELGVADARAVIAPNGVPSPAVKADPTHAVPLIVTAGELGLRKGTDVLIEALAGLPARLDWRAELAGNGEVETYRRRAEQKGIADRVTFHGWLWEDEVTAMMARADIFTLPSREENQPVAILEALARGVPVVSTTIGAIPEQVDDGRTGLLVPPGDPAALRDAFAALLADPARRAQMGSSGVAAFEARFSIARCAEIIADTYQRVLTPDGASAQPAE